MSKLNKSIRIHKLASDLGLLTSETPVTTILKYCEKQVKDHIKEFGLCSTSADLLNILAAKLRTKFETIKSDSDLFAIKKKYVEVGELAVVRLEEELTPDVFGITFRRMSRQAWEPDFLSIIDAREEKS